MRRLLFALLLLPSLAWADPPRRPAYSERRIWPDMRTTSVLIGDHGIPNGGETPCLDPNNLEYLGAFRVPTCYDHSASDPQASSFQYCSDHICFVPAEGGHPASLYLAGYLQGGRTPVRGGKYGRIAIPTPRIRANPNDLLLADVIDSLHAFDGTYPDRYIDHMETAGPQPRMGDIFWLDALVGQTEPHLYMSVWTKYQSPNPDRNIPTFFTNTEGRNNRSHIWNIGPHDSAIPGTDAIRSSPWFMWKHCDFIFLVPETFATANAPGKILAIGNGNRDGGHTLTTGCDSWWASCNSTDPGLIRSCLNQYKDTGRIGVHLGPGFALIDPNDVVSDPADSTETPAAEACGYYESGGGNSHYVEHDWTAPYELPYGVTPYVGGPIERFQDLDFFCEGAYICDTPFSQISEIFGRGKHGVVFVVQKATHQCDYSNPTHCYNGPDACGSPLDCNHCGYVSGHSDDGYPTSLPDVRAELWFFNPNDYANVLHSLADPWTPRAYAKIDLTEIFYQTRGGVCPTLTQNLSIGGVAYDSENCVLYLEEGRAWVDYRVPEYPVIHVFKVHTPPQ